MPYPKTHVWRVRACYRPHNAHLLLTKAGDGTLNGRLASQRSNYYAMIVHVIRKR